MDTKIIQTINTEETVTATRRDFLKKLAYGSVLALGGTDVASATVKSIIDPHQYGHGRTYLPHKEVNKRVIHSTLIRKSKTNSKQILAARSINLMHSETGDKLKLTYFENGRYVKGALHEINHLLRDYRTNDVYVMDTALIDQLFQLRKILNFKKPIQVVSAYRTPITNATLRRTSSGVAEHSYHMEGRAIDIRIEGMQAYMIKKAALSMAKGGVGYYPESNFVHLDTGDIRTW